MVYIMFHLWSILCFIYGLCFVSFMGCVMLMAVSKLNNKNPNWSVFISPSLWCRRLIVEFEGLHNYLREEIFADGQKREYYIRGNLIFFLISRIPDFIKSREMTWVMSSLGEISGEISSKGSILSNFDFPNFERHQI